MESYGLTGSASNTVSEKVAAPNRDMPLTAEINSRTQDHIQLALETAKSLQELSDRLFGPMPQKSGATGPQESPIGFVGNMRDGHDRLMSVLRAGHILAYDLSSRI